MKDDRTAQEQANQVFLVLEHGFRMNISPPNSWIDIYLARKEKPHVAEKGRKVFRKKGATRQKKGQAGGRLAGLGGKGSAEWPSKRPKMAIWPKNRAPRRAQEPQGAPPKMATSGFKSPKTNHWRPKMGDISKAKAASRGQGEPRRLGTGKGQAREGPGTGWPSGWPNRGKGEAKKLKLEKPPPRVEEWAGRPADRNHAYRLLGYQGGGRE